MLCFVFEKGYLEFFVCFLKNLLILDVGSFCVFGDEEEDDIDDLENEFVFEMG